MSTSRTAPVTSDCRSTRLHFFSGSDLNRWPGYSFKRGREVLVFITARARLAKCFSAHRAEKTNRGHGRWFAGALVIFALFWQSDIARAADRPPPRIGLWIECEGARRTLDDAGRIRDAVSDATALGATDLFVQVFRNGKAWFATALADDGPYKRAREKGYDPLAEVLRLAHARGGRVHAWVNLLRVDDGEQSRWVRALGREAVLTDETGRSLLAPGPWGAKRNAKPDTSGAWLDPASPAVTARLTALLVGLLEAYPDLDGVHLDYTRYPIPIGSDGSGADLGWSQSARKRFLADLGANNKGDMRRRWDTWRREQLTAFVRSLRDALKERRPALALSAAVLADPEEAARSALQDWPVWTREGLLDLVVPMNYSLDPVRFDRIARAAVKRRGEATLLMGIGAWRFGDRVNAIAARIQLALDAGAQGAVLFSHDNLKSHPGTLRLLGDLLGAEILQHRETSTAP